MIHWNWNKVNFYNSALKHLSRLPIPIGQNNPHIGTFWYLQHLGPLGLLENVTDFICDFLKLKEIYGKRLLAIPFSLPYTLQHPQNTSLHYKTPSGTQNTSPCPPGTALTSTKRSSDSLRGIWVVKGCLEGLCEKWGCQKMSVECQDGLWVSTAAFGNVKDMSGVLWECLEISECVWGVSRGSWRVKGVSDSIFPSVSFNFGKSQIRSLTFSGRPRGPKCLKYQNVPIWGLFWPIGKPWEMFQSWVIKVYFISVLMEHTVAPKSNSVIIWCCELLRNSASSFHWLSSSIFSCLFVVRPAL